MSYGRSSVMVGSFGACSGSSMESHSHTQAPLMCGLLRSGETVIRRPSGRHMMMSRRPLDFLLPRHALSHPDHTSHTPHAQHRQGYGPSSPVSSTTRAFTAVVTTAASASSSTIEQQAQDKASSPSSSPASSSSSSSSFEATNCCRRTWQRAALEKGATTTAASRGATTTTSVRAAATGQRQTDVVCVLSHCLKSTRHVRTRPRTCSCGASHATQPPDVGGGGHRHGVEVRDVGADWQWHLRLRVPGPRAGHGQDGGLEKDQDGRSAA